MRDSVRAAFPPYVEKWEGRCSWMYLDAEGLVTTGVGNLIDDGTPGPACGLPWVHPGGTRAMLFDVQEAWHKVKAATSMAPLGGGHFAPLTDIRLLPADIDALVLRRLDETETELRKGFPGWDQFPAPAQLCILDMAWNLGAAFEFTEFPKFRALCNAGNWQGAVAECTIVDAPKARNVSHMSLLVAAARGGDAECLPPS